MSTIDTSNIANGFYNAKPTCAGLTKSKNGHDQFAIEFAIEIEDQAEPVVMTTFCGLDGTKQIQRKDGSTTTSLEITMDQAELCGVDTSLDLRQWGESIDTNAQVRVKVEWEEYNGESNPRIRGVYPPGGSGGLIKKNAMDDSSAAAVATKLNAQIKALRAKRGASGGARPATTPQRQAQRQAQPQTRPANGVRPAQPRRSDPDFGGPVDDDGSDTIPF
jgi:hypothetical protein